jgi:putative NIF3 family GTP cyclohydrolase 1 type 2
MTLQAIYDLAIKMGIDADPRGKDRIVKVLSRNKKDYEELPDGKKKYFDKESFKNPYADSRILFGNPDTQIKRVISGIDIDTAEVVLTDRLNQKKEKIDAIIGHHPEGYALAGLDEVMDIQIDLMNSYGIPVNIAEALTQERIGQVRRGLNPANHGKTVDASKLLGIPFMVIHTIWDNIGHNFLSKKLENKGFETVGEVLDEILKLPEFSESKMSKAGPRITVGSEKNRAGKVAVTGFTGGTSGSKLIYEKMAQAGIGTIVEMHMKEEHWEEARKNHLNVIVSGHIASDSLGANLFLDELEKRGIEVIPFSGLIRVKRGKLG